MDRTFTTIKNIALGILVRVMESHGNFGTHIVDDILKIKENLFTFCAFELLCQEKRKSRILLMCQKKYLNHVKAKEICKM